MDRRAQKLQAAKYSAQALKKLQTALKQDAVVDLTTELPVKYSNRLKDMRSSEPSNTDMASLPTSDSVETVLPLLEKVAASLEVTGLKSTPLPEGFSGLLLRAIDNCDVLWKSAFPSQKMVFKWSGDIHKADIPAPEPLGLLRMSGISLMFMSYFSGSTLASQWPALSSAQKALVKNQLGDILTRLRSLPFPSGVSLRGAAGEGCKDARRHLRPREQPLMTFDDFENFLFSGGGSGGHVFVDFLRNISPQTASSKVVFTHGDIRPDSILVEMAEMAFYGGFYPDYYEAVKCTNCLSPHEEDDCYLYLPDSNSPRKYPHWWLLDRVRECKVV
ncbi:hypothetical protein BJX64DRAFT_275029 [Aspergillus heterothallicus]